MLYTLSAFHTLLPCLRLAAESYARGVIIKCLFYGNGTKFDFLNDMVCIYKIIIHPVWPMAKYRRVFWSRILRSNFFSLPNSTSENSATTPNLLCFDSELGRDVISVAGNCIILTIWFQKEQTAMTYHLLNK